MEPERSSSFSKVVVGVIIGLIIVLFGAGLIGWRIGRNSSKSDAPPVTETQTVESDTTATEVDELVTYSVPSGFVKAKCGVERDVIHFIRESQLPNCESVPTESITLEIDSSDHRDCNELEGVDNVTKHVCRSIFIDNRRTLEASTSYTEVSTVLPERTVDVYYMDTGKGVVLAKYIHEEAAPNSTAFNELAYSLRVK